MERANNFKDLTGMTFGRMKVISFNRVEKKESFWNCVCECGKSCVKRGQNLAKGGTKSCGCYALEIRRKSKGTSGFNRLYEEYKLGAKKRDIEFELTEEQVKHITKQNCHYCNIEPSQIKSCNNTEHSQYIYNGIDRKDNNIGYIESNCLPCCLICNRAKNNLSYERFIQYIKRLTTYEET